MPRREARLSVSGEIPSPSTRTLQSQSSGAALLGEVNRCYTNERSNSPSPSSPFGTQALWVLGSWGQGILLTEIDDRSLPLPRPMVEPNRRQESYTIKDLAFHATIKDQVAETQVTQTS